MWAKNIGFSLGYKVQSVFHWVRNNYFLFQTVEFSILSLASECQYRENHVKISPKTEAIPHFTPWKSSSHKLHIHRTSFPFKWLFLRCSEFKGSLHCKLISCLWRHKQVPVNLFLTNMSKSSSQKRENSAFYRSQLGTIHIFFNCHNHLMLFKNKVKGFPGGAVVANLPANAGDTGSSPGLGRSYMPRSN